MTQAAMNKPRKRPKREEAFLAATIPTEHYIVVRDGQACTLINISGGRKGGVLLPGVPVVTFAKHRDAERAIERTEAARATLRSSLVADWMAARLPSFLEGANFAVVPCGHQGGDPRLKKAAASEAELQMSRAAAGGRR